MNPITIIAVCGLFVLGLAYLFMRSRYLKCLNKALDQADYEKAQDLLHKSQAKLLLTKYLIDLYQARVYYLAKNDKALIAHLREMMDQSYAKDDEEQYLSLYYHIFINQGNYEFALELLERIHQCENTKLIRYCDWTKAVLLEGNNNLIDEITEALDNMDYYAFPLGTCAYLMGIQKKRMEAFEEALLWFEAAKDVYQKRDIYRTNVLEEIEKLHEMGYESPKQPQRKKKRGARF